MLRTLDTEKLRKGMESKNILFGLKLLTVEKP